MVPFMCNLSMAAGEDSLSHSDDDGGVGREQRCQSESQSGPDRQRYLGTFVSLGLSLSVHEDALLISLS